jgi:NAD-dependent dihydropyrimidine dehydrogenase PreA subunit
MPRRSPSRWLLWYPTIDYDVCRSDLTCLNFCPQGVFEWEEETGRPVVAHPYRCVPGCNLCAETCTAHAISFPSREQVRAALRRLRAEVGKENHAAGSS